MIVADLPRRQLEARLADRGICLQTGPLSARIRSRLPAVIEGISLHYRNHRIDDAEGFADFDVCVRRPATVRRWVKPQAHFSFDGQSPFTPLPLDQAFAMLEWGLNWCVSAHCHQYLIFHAAVVERSGRALVLPAPPGSGKSTLCAGLIHRGWRLLSDELALIDFASCAIQPMPRPVSLKNGSIDVMRAFAPAALIGPPVHDTIKGSVAHMRPPADSVGRAMEAAQAGWIVFPRYRSEAPAALTVLPKERAVMQMANNAFNYGIHGRRGFELLTSFVDRCGCYEFEYGNLDEAACVFDRLASER